MIRGVGDNALAKAAIDAALRSVQSDARRVEQSAGQIGSLELDKSADVSSSFERVLTDGIGRADQAVRAGEQLPLDLLSGKVGDFHEVAAALKQSELMFKFSLEVRNKLIDAYRETMRMTV